MSVAATTKSKENETDVPFSSLGDVRRNGVRSVSTAEGSRGPSLAGRLPTKNPRSSACGKVGDGTPDTGGIMGTRPPEWLVASSPAKRSTAAGASCSSQQKTPPG